MASLFTVLLFFQQQQQQNFQNAVEKMKKVHKTVHDQKRQLFVPGPPWLHQKRKFSVSFSCYPFSLTRLGASA